MRRPREGTLTAQVRAGCRLGYSDRKRSRHPSFRGALDGENRVFKVNEYFDGRVKSLAFRGESFTVAANVKFDVRATEETSYLCLYR